jgi:hypothetical protein
MATDAACIYSWLEQKGYCVEVVLCHSRIGPAGAPALADLLNGYTCP